MSKCNFIYCAKVDSTNSEMKRRLDACKLKNYSCIYTDFQSAGRGQTMIGGKTSNVWESEPKKNLIFSLLIRPENIPVDMQFFINQVVAIAIADELNDLLPEKNVVVKWPNDIYYNDKKLCGVLIENTIIGRNIDTSIVGVGVNVNQQEFLNAPNPTSLAIIAGRLFNVEKLRKSLVKRMIKYYEEVFDQCRLSLEELYYRYFALLYRRDGLHKYATPGGDAFLASIVGVDASGLLSLKHADGSLHKYAFKELIYILD